MSLPQALCVLSGPNFPASLAGGWGRVAEFWPVEVTCAPPDSISLVLWLGGKDVLDDGATDGDAWTLRGQAEATTDQERLCWPLEE